jgi:excisionase family DNA binding protein
VSLWTVPETAERLRVSRRTVYRLIADRRLKITKVRGGTFVSEAEILRFLRDAERRRVA